MNEELKEVLAFYTQEEIDLREQINETVNGIETDYKIAHYHFKALGQVCQKIEILKALLDPHYQEKKRYNLEIDYWVKLLEIAQDENRKEYIQHNIDQKLDIINNYKPSYFNDGQEFDDLIFDLIERKISSFIFHFKKSANLYLKFKIKKTALIISLTPFLKISEDYYFTKYITKRLSGIGFKKNKSKTRFQLKHPISNFKNSIEVKTIVSRIIYEVFSFEELDNPSTLEITASPA